MKSNEIRSGFREFFLENAHESRPSSSLVPAKDPTVLLTTAGMQQFKPYFLGIQPPPHPRLTTCQKCFRTTDIDRVGKTARHLTFFEMLGNFSFGDYFKEGAVDLAWRFSTQVLKLDTSRIWVSIFQGDDKVGADEEARAAWKAAGMAEERIVPLPAEDNFWSAGPTGPCGPCTELYYDLGREAGCDDPGCKPGCDCDRFVEYWNLVFMQFNRDEAGALTPLPKQNVDTGMGLERITAIMEGKLAVFETDMFQPVVDYICETAGVRYGVDRKTDRAIRVLADHSRAMTFLIGDGVFAGNEGRGYVLRRVMRRAIQSASTLEIGAPFLSTLCDRVVEAMKDTYPELEQHRRMIDEVATQEEHRFGMTLEQGNAILMSSIEDTRGRGGRMIEGEVAFRLHDTYGFPFDLTREIIQDEGLDVDDEEFDRLMDEQRERARTSMKEVGSLEREALADLGRSAKVHTEFVGYEKNELHTSIGDLKELEGGRVVLKLRESPFYAESGGQISDTGWIHTDDGKANVVEVFSLDGDQVILAELEEGRLEAGARAKAMINRVRRHATACNHSATHLLHNALRSLLGEQVRQGGSSVGPDKLRFDFTHTRALTEEELRRIEDIVNRKIIENHPVKAFTTTMDYARDMGAIALFDEKYGEFVRVIEMGDFSRELCGGTHVTSTSQIGCLKIVSESSVGANLRRIEAITSKAAIEYLRGRDRQVDELAAGLKTEPERLGSAITSMEEELKELRILAKAATSGKMADIGKKMLAKAVDISGMRVLAEQVDVSSVDELMELSDLLREELNPAAVVLALAADGRVTLVANFSDAVVGKGAKAGDLIKDIAPIVGGKGGGRPTMARGGGNDAGKVGEAIQAATDWLTQKLS
ncbi:MAG: alanine--tRNA ligase [Thermoleophilia bacterium]|nr:alanine--tRNA ligase [Thermoleophilia bacterium]